MLWADENVRIPSKYFSFLVLLKSLDKRLSRDKTLKENYAKAISDDLEKRYVNTVPDAQMVEEGPDKEWYLLHHPVTNPKKTGKLRRILIGTANFTVLVRTNLCLLAPTCSRT